MPQTMARDEAGNIWEVDAQGNPVRLVQRASNGAPSVVAPNPSKVKDDQQQQTNRDLDAEGKRLDNAMKRQKLDDDAAARVALSLQPDSKVHGEAYIKTLPADAQGIVRSLLQGNLPVGTRGITSKELLPYLKMAINADPTFSANTFTARQTASKQLADMKATGGYLTSLTANIDHSREEEAAINRLNNPGGIYGRWGGAALHNWWVNKGGPAEAQFNQANRVYSGEQVKSITGNVGTAGGGSALADRQEAENAISASMPIDAQRAALRTGAIQNYQKFHDANAAYRRTMGTDIPDAMSPAQAAQLLHLMRLQDDGTEGPIPEGTDPSFVALATGGGSGPHTLGPSGIGGNGGGPKPPSGPAPSAAGYGATQTSVKIPAEMQAAQAEYLRRNWGKLDPGGYTAFRTDLDRKYGFTSDPAAYRDDVTRFNDYAKKGVRPDQIPGIPAPARDLSAIEQVRNDLVANPAGAAIAAGMNSYSFGLPALFAGDQMAALRSRYPVSTTIGDIAGSFGGVGLARRGLKAGAEALANPTVESLLAKPLAADLAYGGIYGGTTAASEGRDPLTGVVTGVGGAVLGNRLGNVIGRTAPIITGLRAPTSYIDNGERLVLDAVNRTGRDEVASALARADDLGVPMSLADASSDVNSLTGAAIRRSPTAAGQAGDVLADRSAGQYDRFLGAVERDLGPITDIPARSDALIQRARAEAGPLYDRAYAQPTGSSPRLDELINTPFGQSAFKRAGTIAQNERVDPNALSIDFNAAGEPFMRETPNWRTLDLVKRGMDDVLEGYRDPVTGRMNLDETGRSQLGVRNEFVDELDRMNDLYRQARTAYAGPASEASALRSGQSALSVSPNQLRSDFAKASPTQQEQIRLGYTSALADRAGRVRDSSNPFEAVLGSPEMRARVDVIHGDNPDANIARLLDQRDLERQVAASTNRLTGNSLTSQRQVADRAFDADNSLAGDLASGAIETMLTGAPVATALRSGIARNIGQRFSDWRTFGAGRRAIESADQIVPLTLDTNPARAGATLSDIIHRDEVNRLIVQSLLDTAGSRASRVGTAIVDPVVSALLTTPDNAMAN